MITDQFSVLPGTNKTLGPLGVTLSLCGQSQRLERFCQNGVNGVIGEILITFGPLYNIWPY